MQRNAFAALLTVLVLLGTVVWVSATRQDQEAAGTPDTGTPDAVEACPTVDLSSPVPLVDAVATPLSSGILTILDPCRLTMARWFIQPGGSIPVDDYPPAVIYVESGVVTFTLHEGVALVWPMHVEDDATPVVASGGSTQTFDLNEGDSVFLQNSTYEVSNNGATEAELTISAVKRRRGDCPTRCWEWP